MKKCLTPFTPFNTKRAKKTTKKQTKTKTKTKKHVCSLSYLHRFCERIHNRNGRRSHGRLVHFRHDDVLWGQHAATAVGARKMPCLWRHHHCANWRHVLGWADLHQRLSWTYKKKTIRYKYLPQTHCRRNKDHGELYREDKNQIETEHNLIGGTADLPPLFHEKVSTHFTHVVSGLL